MNNKKFYRNIIEKIKIQSSSNKNLDQLTNSNYSAKFEKDGVVLFIFLDGIEDYGVFYVFHKPLVVFAEVDLWECP